MAKNNLEIKRVTVTPEMARQMLKQNGKNRPLRKRVWEGYASEMKSGKWQSDTTETIKLDQYGNILDGQHRLTAIEQSGVTLDIWIAYNVPEETFEVIDTGLKRTGGDVLYINGVKNAFATSSAIRGYLFMKAGRLTSKDVRGAEVFNTDVVTEYQKKPQFWEKTVLQINEWYVGFYRTLKPAFIAAHYMMYRAKDHEKAVDFFNKLCFGTNLSERSPVYKLRDILTKDKSSARKMSSYHKSGLMIKAWNLFREGKTTERLVFDPNKEEMPKAK